MDYLSNHDILSLVNIPKFLSFKECLEYLFSQKAYIFLNQVEYRNLTPFESIYTQLKISCKSSLESLINSADHSILDTHLNNNLKSLIFLSNFESLKEIIIQENPKALVLSEMMWSGPSSFEALNEYKKTFTLFNQSDNLRTLILQRISNDHNFLFNGGVIIGGIGKSKFFKTLFDESSIKNVNDQLCDILDCPCFEIKISNNSFTLIQNKIELQSFII